MSTPEESEPVQPEASAAPVDDGAPERALASEPAAVGDRAVIAEVTEVTDETVALHRAPRYGRFILLGAVVGAILALILTFAFPENEQFDRGQVFGFLLLGLGVIGAAFGAVVALVFDRVLSSRGGQAIVAHESTRPIE